MKTFEEYRADSMTLHPCQAHGSASATAAAESLALRSEHRAAGRMVLRHPGGETLVSADEVAALEARGVKRAP
jgi:hypothetical protein